ncbi:MAG TPA: hypothetical protein VGP82_09315 [Ktedonobacterales bacterium]|nr:hypothetical protein [Ktedonobacterales bacterium]
MAPGGRLEGGWRAAAPPLARACAAPGGARSAAPRGLGRPPVGQADTTRVGGVRGDDGTTPAKRVGRKRHVLVAPAGRLRALNVHATTILDRDAIKAGAPRRIRGCCGRGTCWL